MTILFRTFPLIASISYFSPSSTYAFELYKHHNYLLVSSAMQSTESSSSNIHIFSFVIFIYISNFSLFLSLYTTTPAHGPDARTQRGCVTSLHIHRESIPDSMTSHKTELHTPHATVCILVCYYTQIPDNQSYPTPA